MNAKISNQLFIVVALIKAINYFLICGHFFFFSYIYKIFSFKDKNRMQWIILLISVFSFLISMITRHFFYSFIISLPISYLLLYGGFLKNNKR